MKFVDNSKEVKRELERAVIRGLIKAAMLVESQAVLLVPVDTGALRNSIGYKVNESELAAYIGTNCEYAIYVEYGKKTSAVLKSGKIGEYLLCLHYT